MIINVVDQLTMIVKKINILCDCYVNIYPIPYMGGEILLWTLRCHGWHSRLRPHWRKDIRWSLIEDVK